MRSEPAYVLLLAWPEAARKHHPNISHRLPFGTYHITEPSTMGRVQLHYRSYVVTCNTVLLALSNRFRAGPWTPAQCVHGHATVRSVHVGARDLSRAPFETLPIHQLIEEERLPGYKADRYFPASIGQIWRNRYQIVGKVGYGGGSTVWACRDLKYITDEPLQRG